MIKIILSSFLVTLLYTPLGIYFHKGNNLISFSLQLIFGLIIISFFALFLNFFFPLSQILNSIFILLSFLILFKYRKIYFSKNFFIFCTFSSFIIFLLIASSDIYRPDAGLYHLPFINILNEEKIIIGISNLHFRFGHISIIQYISAFTNNIIFETNGIIFAGPLIASSVIINFLSHLYINIKNKKIDFHFLFIFSVLVFILYKMNRFGEYGNDAPAHFLMFFLVSEIIKNFHNTKIKDISNYFLISIFIIMNKVILITSILFPMVFFLKNKMTFKILDKKFFFIFLFLILWSLKNILVSGCFLYPLKISCLSNLSWSNIEKASNVSIENEAWAKGWPDFRKINIKKVSQSEYREDFLWLKTWANNHFLIILKILIPYIALLIIVLIIFILKSERKTKLKKEKFIYILLAISLIGILMWFYKVPTFRYGYSYIILFISIIFAIIGSKFLAKKKSILIFKYLIVFLLIIFSLKNLNRIIFENKNYFNYPWPKFYSYNKDNKILNHKYKVINNKKIYLPLNEYCMYSKAPCGKIHKNLKIEYKKNYLFMLIESK